jgi:hypothetical protein
MRKTTQQLLPLKVSEGQGKQSNNIHKQKRSKIQNNRKVEKRLHMAQKKGTEILQVSNPKTFGN